MDESWCAAHLPTIETVPPHEKMHKLSHMVKYLDMPASPRLLSHMENNYDAIFSAMSDPTRRAVVARLAAGPATVTDLHAPHDIALPTFMKHLRKLENAGLVHSKKSGRIRTVSLNQNTLQAAETWIARQRRQWERRLDRLQNLADRMDRTTS